MAVRDGRVLIVGLLMAVCCLLVVFVRQGPPPKDKELQDLLSAVKELRKSASHVSHIERNLQSVDDDISHNKDTHSKDTDKYDKGRPILGMDEDTINQINSDLTQKENGSFVITNHYQALSLIKWDFEKPPEYVCKNTTKGGVYLICNDPPYTVKPPCLVYSFGIYNEWGFDMTAGKMGCEVHAFDPSVPWDDHIHKKVVNFHKLGIGKEDTDSYKPPRSMYVKEDQTWRLRTLPSIMKMLGHEGRVLDILKVDVEGWEWFVLEQLIETGLLHRVRQLLFEWHLIRDFPRKRSYIYFLKLYTKLKDAGFKIFSSDFRFQGYTERRWRIQSDGLYVNSKFKP